MTLKTFYPTISWAGLLCEIASETPSTITLRNKDGDLITVGRGANLHWVSSRGGKPYRFPHKPQPAKPTPSFFS